MDCAQGRKRHEYPRPLLQRPKAVCVHVPKYSVYVENKKLAEIDYTKKYVFVERSIWSDKHIFAKNCYLSKLISEIEYQVYNIWFSWIENVCTERLNPESIRFIYLKCSPETSFFRTNKRGRPEESDIKLDYLAQIHNQHEEWVAKDDVDWTIIDAEKDLTIKEQFISEYTQFISKIG